MFIKNFFRKDLALNKRWWHRLLSVIFFLALLYFLVEVWDTPLPKYNSIGYLNDRMSSNLQLLPELIGSNEKVGVYENNLHGDSYEKNEGWLLRQPNIYCSDNIANNIENISGKTGVEVYKGNGPSEYISLEEFKNYLLKQNAKCVSVNVINGTKVISWEVFVGNDLKVWEQSFFASFVYILKESLLVILSFIVLLVIYYKIFLYIIFGKKN